MKAVALISEGIDSPVAAYLMIKKGLNPVLLNGSPDGEKNINVERMKEQLSKVTGKELRTMYYNHYNMLEKIADKCEPKYRCIICKRMMYRKAEEQGVDFIITGENLGQVASQTLKNLRVLDSAVSTPILRPLIGFNKNEIISIAKNIGTYEFSVKATKCPFLPSSPATRTSLKKVNMEEEKLNN